MTAEKSFMELLRKSGYKATHSRLAILSIFKKTKKPLSAQEIIEQLPRGTDQATVYRTITALKNKGIIRQIDLRHNHAHYELADIKDHHHLICLRCGRMEDVEHCGIENMQAGIVRSSKHFAEIRTHALEFYGLCKTCTKKKETSETAIYKNAPR